MKNIPNYATSVQEAQAIAKIFNGYQELQALGWKDPRALLHFSPDPDKKWKDGLFYSITLGSTGVATTQHLSNDAIHAGWACEANDLWPVCVLLVKEP